MQKPKVYLVIFITFFVTAVCFQNSSDTILHFFFWHFRISQIFVILASFLVGIGFGFLIRR